MAIGRDGEGGADVTRRHGHGTRACVACVRACGLGRAATAAAAAAAEGTSSTAQPMTMQSGTTKRAICVDEPMAMPSASSILFLTAKMIAAACSAALPTIGMTMVPRKRSGTPQFSDAPCDDGWRWMAMDGDGWRWMGRVERGPAGRRGRRGRRGAGGAEKRGRRTCGCGGRVAWRGVARGASRVGAWRVACRRRARGRPCGGHLQRVDHKLGEEGDEDGDDAEPEDGAPQPEHRLLVVVVVVVVVAVDVAVTRLL